MCLTCGCSRLAPSKSVDIAALSFASPSSTPSSTSSTSSTAPASSSPAASSSSSSTAPPVRPAPPTRQTVQLEHALTAKNDAQAGALRDRFARQRIFALNLLSSPGAGKTTLLERTLTDVGDALGISVIEGDQETSRDAERLRASGRRVVQVNTGAGCHLDADMITRALAVLEPADDSSVVVENVGNLVCPALFDLGERHKVVVFSVTEGEDKPIKYPHMFKAATLLVLNKIDLLPHLRFDVDACLAFVREVNPRVPVLLLSATSGQGLDAWYDWLRAEKQKIHAAGGGR